MASKGSTLLLPKEKRVLSFDFARGCAVLFMIMVHISDLYGSLSYKKSVSEQIIQFLGHAPCAPVFMFFLGFFTILSPQKSFLSRLKRAVMLFLAGYTLNLFRLSIPIWLSLQMGLTTQDELGPYTPLNQFLAFDILQFAGLALIVCFVLQDFFTSPAYWLAFATMITLGSPMLWRVNFDNQTVNTVMALLWGGESQGVFFPLFPWLAFPLLGMVFGYSFKQTTDRNMWQKKLAFPGLALFILGNYFLPEFIVDSYALLEPGVVIWIMGFILIWIWICHLIIETLPSSKFFELLFYWSKNATTIYIIHWIILAWGVMVVGYQKMTTMEILYSIPVLLLIIHLVTRFWLCRHKFIRSLLTLLSSKKETKI